MDFQRFGIDERLAGLAAGFVSGAVFHEKMLVHAIQKKENVCAKVSLGEGREEVILLPALQWLASGENTAQAGQRVLIAVPDEVSAEKIAATARRLALAIDVDVCLIADDSETGVPVYEGEPSAQIVVGLPSALLAASSSGTIDLRQYGFLVVDAADRLAEMSSDFLRRFSSSLLPSWERRTLLACARITVKTRNLSLDLADNPSEIQIEGDVVKAQSAQCETWYLPAEDKVRFLLGLFDREKPARVCVFCNLKGTATELSKRLVANGVSSDYILGSLAEERNFAILEKCRSGEQLVLVLTDEGAQEIPKAEFPLCINYDIPLEPEFFVRRMEMLDRDATGAKIVSMACDRYAIGLPAIEQYIEMKLDAKTVDESLLLAVDRSSGMHFDNQQRSPGRDRPGRSPRAPQDGNRADGRRSQERRGPPRLAAEGPSRDQRRPRDPALRDDRSPDIRRSIAEATGGSLDFNDIPRGPLAKGPERNRPERKPNPPSARREGGRKDGRGAGDSKGGRRGAAKPEVKPAARRADSRREAPQRPPEPSGNPYDMSMEERMRRYREKYGRRLGNERSDENRQQGGRQGQQPGGKGGGGKQESRKGQGRNPGTPRGPRDGGRRGPRPQAEASGSSRPSQAAGPPPEKSRGEQAPEQAKGIFGRLFGSLRKKD